MFEHMYQCINEIMTINKLMLMMIVLGDVWLSFSFYSC